MYFRGVEERILWMHVIPVAGPSVPATLVSFLRSIFDPICRALREFNYVIPIYQFVNNSEHYEEIRTRYPYYSLNRFCLLYRETFGCVTDQGRVAWLGRRIFYLICSNS